MGFATIIILIVGIVVFGAIIFASLIYSVAGSWERMEGGQGVSEDVGFRRERINLAQMGPVVIGDADVPGGRERYLGFALGPWVFLRRRDFGARFLARQGFPEDLVSQLEGRVMGRLQLKLGADRLLLEGHFVSYKVEFDRNPPKVKRIYPIAKAPRAYRRSELIVDEEVSIVPNPVAE